MAPRVDSSEDGWVYIMLMCFCTAWILCSLYCNVCDVLLHDHEGCSTVAPLIFVYHGVSSSCSRRNGKSMHLLKKRCPSWVHFSSSMLSGTGRAYTMLRQNEWCYSGSSSSRSWKTTVCIEIPLGVTENVHLYSTAYQKANPPTPNPLAPLRQTLLLKKYWYQPTGACIDIKRHNFLMSCIVSSYINHISSSQNSGVWKYTSTPSLNAPEDFGKILTYCDPYNHYYCVL